MIKVVGKVELFEGLFNSILVLESTLVFLWTNLELYNGMYSIIRRSGFQVREIPHFIAEG